MPTLTCEVETYPIAGRFVIARGAKTEAHVVTVTIAEAAGANGPGAKGPSVQGPSARGPSARGRGECVPYARYGETIESVVAAIRSVAAEVERAPDRAALQGMLPRGAARNAIDCALWDLEAKRTGRRAAAIAGLAEPTPVVTAFTISLDTPEAMAAAAARAFGRPLLKVKLGGEGDELRLRAVRAAVPHAALVVDANEAWHPRTLKAMFAACVEADVKLIEQPLPADDDGMLGEVPHPVPICADESVHDRDGLAALRGRYDAVNIKLDKTGGLTEALAVAAEAERLGFTLMVGCMVGTSLAMAPALLLAPRARYVDLDGPLLLAHDRPNGLAIDGSTIAPASPELWG